MFLQEGALSGFSKLRFSKPVRHDEKGCRQATCLVPQILPIRQNLCPKQTLAGAAAPLTPREGFVPDGIVCHANKGAKMYRTNQQSARLNLD